MQMRLSMFLEMLTVANYIKSKITQMPFFQNLAQSIPSLPFVSKDSAKEWITNAQSKTQRSNKVSYSWVGKAIQQRIVYLVAAALLCDILSNVYTEQRINFTKTDHKNRNSLDRSNLDSHTAFLFLFCSHIYLISEYLMWSKTIYACAEIKHRTKYIGQVSISKYQVPVRSIMEV